MSGQRQSRDEYPRRQTGTAVGFALLIGLFCVLRYTAILEANAASWLEDIAWTAFALAAAWQSLRTARSAPTPRFRRAWHFLGLAAGSWFGGMLWLLWGRLADPSFVPYPTPANWLFLGFAPLFTAGIFHLRTESPGSGVGGRRLADLGLIVTAISLVVIFILLEPVLQAGRFGGAAVFSVLDPVVFTTALVFTMASVALGALADIKVVGRLLLATVFLHTVGDLLYFRGTLEGSLPNVPLQWIWLAAFAAQVIAARTFEDQSRRGIEEEKEGESHNLGVLEASLPALLLASVLLVGILDRDAISDRVLLVAAPLLAAFTLFLGLRGWWVDRSEGQMFARLLHSKRVTEQVLAASPARIFTMAFGADRPLFAAGAGVVEEGETSAAEWTWAQCIHPEDYPRFMDEVESARLEEARTFEVRVRTPGQAYRWTAIRLASYLPAGSHEQHIIGSLVDIDTMKQLELTLMRSQRMEALGQLSGGVAHDFNNLLTTILGHAELGVVDPESSGRAIERFNQIIGASERAGRVTQQLLAFSREQHLTMEVVELSALVRNMVGILAPVIGEKTVLDLRADDPVERVYADPTQIEQIILNLIVNARDAMPDGGRLTVSTGTLVTDGTPGGIPAGRYASLTVEDEGIGMSESVRAQVFEPFFTTKPKGEGTGLGLSTLHGVVRQHAGHVEVESRPGQGAVFKVLLPVAPAEPGGRA